MLNRQDAKIANKTIFICLGLESRIQHLVVRTKEKLWEALVDSLLHAAKLQTVSGIKARSHSRLNRFYSGFWLLISEFGL